MTMTCACVTDDRNEVVATCATHLRAAAASPPEPGRTPRRSETVCREPDIVNAPYLGAMAYCEFQRPHCGPHSWIDDPMGPRHPDERHRSEAQRDADYAQSRARQRHRP